MESLRLSKPQRLKRRSIMLTTLIVIISGLLMILSASAEVFTDQFDGDRLDAGIWELHRGKNEENKIFLRDGYLNIHAAGDNNMFPDIDDSIKLLMKRGQKNNWSVTTSVSFNTDPQNNWSGIIVYDSTNQPSTDWLCLWFGHTGTSIVMRGLSANSLTPRKTILFVNKQGAELRLDKANDNYTAFFRALGGAEWTEIGQIKIKMPGTYKVGLVTSTLADHNKSEAAFDYFTFSSEELNLEEIFAVDVKILLLTAWGGIKAIAYE